MLGSKGLSKMENSADASSCPPVIIVEGNIGVGKSTLARELAASLGLRVFLEPTKTNPYLEKFYQDPAKWALRFQLWIYRQRFQMYIAALKHIVETGQGVLMDRSVWSDVVFARVGKNDGIISEEGYRVYERLRVATLRHMPAPLVTVYLDADPEQCFHRVHKLRQRECEKGLPLDYLEKLHHSYHHFLGDMDQTASAVVRVNWQSFGNIDKVVGDITPLLFNGNTPHKWRAEPSLVHYLYADDEIQRSMIVRVDAQLLAEVGEESGMEAVAVMPDESQQAAEAAEHERLSTKGGRAAAAAASKRPHLRNITNSAGLVA